MTMRCYIVLFNLFFSVDVSSTFRYFVCKWVQKTLFSWRVGAKKCPFCRFAVQQGKKTIFLSVYYYQARPTMSFYVPIFRQRGKRFPLLTFQWIMDTIRYPHVTKRVQKMSFSIVSKWGHNQKMSFYSLVWAKDTIFFHCQ